MEGRSNFEFFKVLVPGMYEEALGLPAKLAPVLGARRDLKLQLAGGDTMPLWDVEVFEKHGDMYLGGGWKKFARSHDLDEGYVLVFCYGGRDDLIVTVFDLTTCHKEYSLRPTVLDVLAWEPKSKARCKRRQHPYS